MFESINQQPALPLWGFGALLCESPGNRWRRGNWFGCRRSLAPPGTAEIRDRL